MKKPSRMTIALPMAYIVSTFYKFFSFPDYFEHRGALTAFMAERGMVGNVLLAAEGINATVCGTRQAVDELYEYFKTLPIGEVEVKESEADAPSFRRLKIKLKKELISLGKPANAMCKVGEYVDSERWNELISNPDTIVLDSRNDYEFDHGTFEGAINPKIDDFKQLPAFIKQLGPDKEKPIATFCTGGIRCEKLTAYLLDEGYKNVYHLKGGIIQYLKDMPEAESKWQGKCFVFDDRIAVGHGDA